ncbi:hypothetical protein N8306_01975 [Yoonia sp.]|nr:hypothetical protein [Yoonia sp.]
MTTSSLSAPSTLQRHGLENDRAKLLLNRWLEKASKKKGLLSTVSILPLAACGGSETKLLSVVTKLLSVVDGDDISSETALGPVIIDFGDATAKLTLDAAQTSLSILETGADAGVQTIYVDEVASFTGDANIEVYEITTGSEFTVGALDQDMTEVNSGLSEASSTVVFDAGEYTGTFAGLEGEDFFNVVDGTDISGATGLDAGTIDFGDATAKLTLDAAQNASLSILETGADAGVQTIYVDEVASFTGDANIEVYEITTGSEFTVGALDQDMTEVNSGLSEASSTVVFDAGEYTGTFAGLESSDVLRVVDGTDISGAILLAGTLDFQDANATVELTVAQHNLLLVSSASADSGTQAITLSDAGSLTSKAGIEQYNLADVGGSTFTQGPFNDSVKVVSGTGNDLIITNHLDANRGNLEVDFASGGNDTIRLFNDTGSVNSTGGLVNSDFGGFGGSIIGGSNAQYNEGTLELTAGEWNTTTGMAAADIVGFIATANDNDRDTVELAHFTGAVLEAVNRTTSDLRGIASGSVLEINTASFTVSGEQFDNLKTIATMLDTLSNVADGEYYIVAYNGSDTNADAGLYYARATEGDGFDFADTNGAAAGYDTDSLELMAIFHEVGADSFSSLNFAAAPQIIA